MKLMWITPECPYPDNSGGRVATWKKILYLSEYDDIYLYFISDDAADADFVPYMKQFCKEVKLYPREKSMGTLLKSLKYPYPAVSRWNKRMFTDLDSDFQSKNPDFVIVDFPQMIGGLPERLIKSKRLILNEHNIEYLSMYSLAKSMPNTLKKSIYRYVAKQEKRYEISMYARNEISLYTFVSSEDKDYFEKHIRKNNTLLLPIGADVKKLNPILQECYNVCFIAKMSYQPNSEAALWVMRNVWDQVVSKVPEAKLYIVGKDPTEEVILTAKSHKRVEVTGTVESIQPYYDKCNLVLVPIFSGGGVKVKLLEALGNGKIVLTTTTGIIGTKFKADKHVIVEDQPDGFAKKCIEILLNPEKFDSMRSANYDFMMEEYSWKGICDSFQTKLNEMKNAE